MTSCRTIEVGQRVISVDRFEKATLDNADCTGVTILKTFPSKMLCDSDTNFANLYLCKKISSNDTVYVFELCQKVLEFAVDKNFKENVCIMKDNVRFRIPKQVTVFVTNKFEISPNSKYIFSSLTRLND